MISLLVEPGNLDGIFILIFGILLGPPLLFFLIGFLIKRNNPKSAKVAFILGGIYLIIGLGICGTLMNS